LKSVGPKHDVYGMELGVDIVLVLAAIEFIFLPSSWYVAAFRIYRITEQFG